LKDPFRDIKRRSKGLERNMRGRKGRLKRGMKIISENWGLIKITSLKIISKNSKN